MLFFLGGEVTVKLYQFRNPLGGFAPRKSDTRGGTGNTAFTDFNSFRVVPFVNLAVGDYWISAANSIFLFEKCGVFLLGKALLKLLVDTVFPVFKIASGLQYRVNVLLGNRKSGGLFFGFCRFLRFNRILLFFDGG